MAREFSGVVLEAAAARGLVENLVVDDEAQAYSCDPAILRSFVRKPGIELGKFAGVEVALRDGDEIDVAAGFVESVVGQRAPEVEPDEIVAEDRGEAGGHRVKKVG